MLQANEHPIDEGLRRAQSSRLRPSLPETVLALLKGRRSIRRYQPDPVPNEMVEQVLEAGRWAPSASNRQPWSFIVVRDETIRQQVAQHSAYYFIRWAHVGEAPLLIVLCGDARNPIYRRFLHEDVGLAGGQMMLQAKALGLGTCWIGALDRKAIAAILKLPDHLDIVGLLTVGFPAEDPPPPPRKLLAEIVHYDVYGNRADDGGATPGRLPVGPLGILLRRLRLPFRV
jgi:nitroreductase